MLSTRVNCEMRASFDSRASLHGSRPSKDGNLCCALRSQGAPDSIEVARKRFYEETDGEEGYERKKTLVYLDVSDLLWLMWYPFSSNLLSTHQEQSLCTGS